MPKCEWVEIVDCPSSLYDNCQVRQQVSPLLGRISEIEKHWENRTGEDTSEYSDLSGELGEIACGGCPLRQKLFDEIEWNDFTDDQLASVGASKLPL